MLLHIYYSTPCFIAEQADRRLKQNHYIDVKERKKSFTPLSIDMYGFRYKEIYYFRKHLQRATGDNRATNVSFTKIVD